MSTSPAEQPAPAEPAVPAEDLSHHRALQLLLWKMRHRFPDLAVTVTDTEAAALNACCDYLELKPSVLVRRPVTGQAGQPMVPAPYVVIAMVAEGTGNAIRAIENNQADRDRQIIAERVLAIASGASMRTTALINGLRAGSFSENEIAEALADFATLAKAYLEA